MPSEGPAKSSLVNCNHLATTDTKPGQEETLAKRLARKTKESRRRAAQRFMYRQALETLRGVALRRAHHDLEGPEQSKGKKREWSAARDCNRMAACQSQWIVYKPSCCNSRSAAVPIGCNHRLCPLCNAARLQRYREPARELLAAMENPTFLTLTVPNVGELERATLDQLRRCWKEFFRTNKSLLRGGIYSIECTHNREEKTWHPHLHIVFDAPWPMRAMKHDVFVDLKQMFEFSWLRTTSAEARNAFRRNEYARWKAEAAQQVQGSEWNQQFRRVVDIRRVKNDSSAVYELVKYISKTNRFLDNPPQAYFRVRSV